MSQQSTNRTFDDLARALAEGSISRRRALKLFAGSAIAALIPSRALADDDDDCVRICHVPFDREKEECEPAKAVTRCVSRRERRRHLENHPCDCRGSCRNCLTPECLPNGAPCSTGGTPCCSGNCTGGFCCESGRVGLSNGTCATPCTGIGTECPGCSAACGDTTANVRYCINFPTTAPGCQNDADCALGLACVRTQPTSGECWPVC